MSKMTELTRFLIFAQVSVVLAWGFSDMDTGPATASSTQPSGDRFKIEGRAIVPGVRTQDWVSRARVLVEGEEFVGFLR